MQQQFRHFKCGGGVYIYKKKKKGKGYLLTGCKAYLPYCPGNKEHFYMLSLPLPSFPGSSGHYPGYPKLR